MANARKQLTMVFADLRGFTAFSDMAEPEEVIALLNSYLSRMTDLVFKYEGTLDKFLGDGMLVFFNDPVPCVDPAERAVRMAVGMRGQVGELMGAWGRRGYDLELGVGIAQGYATLGRIGFEGRFDYAAIGPVTNIAARLCAEAAGGQILITQRVQAETEHLTRTEPVLDLALKGFARPVPAFHVVALTVDP